MSTSHEVRRRNYDNRRRQADAEARQHRIVQEATTLFVEQGFAATSIDQIAKAAEVSAQTIYATHGSKAGVLSRAIDVAVVGDHAPDTVADRLPVLTGDSIESYHVFFAVTASFVRGLHERVAPLVRVMLQAGLDEVRMRLTREMHANCALLVARLGSAMRTGLTEAQAADILVTIQSPYVYSMLIDDVGWSPDQYEQWLADTLARMLLRPELLAE
ncbi:TetR family transcriptional regulator [Mycobacterium intermedium]|uniref:TetR family transcriptional regulator n=1 Tax=Mycobacterium intermedium TaxID=28445 RepID=A0A1E3SBH4_MYCIE|nr:TetR/AcrR family transcriptional regulator [Mycobacterium intermedium]MCV6965841.1 TetR/AcrR family transcriptional regulator [Mycobacterium intermedium]ODQ99498.1 TetR family transcriptional regulator [Mycobacterium intermedium]OPE50801.1 TetR family transcriptional regulator [Mycobacterium intermedium]ORB10122.1 TetR family transcriptional regulator [Mycobacterium intermedium]